MRGRDTGIRCPRHQRHFAVSEQELSGQRAEARCGNGRYPPCAGQVDPARPRRGPQAGRACRGTGRAARVGQSSPPPASGGLPARPARGKNIRPIRSSTSAIPAASPSAAARTDARCGASPDTKRSCVIQLPTKTPVRHGQAGNVNSDNSIPVSGLPTIIELIPARWKTRSVVHQGQPLARPVRQSRFSHGETPGYNGSQ